MSNLMVAIQMVTYNHEKYIAQAIESVMMQQADFNYKLIICEDYSTDNTRNICIDYKNKYPDKIDLILNEKNIGIRLNAIQVHKACYESNAKYVAVLEGDDYWTDNLKLQKQVNFLETNPSYTVCFHQVEEVTLYKDGGQSRKFYNKTDKEDFIFEDFILSNDIATVSCLYVNKLFKYDVFERTKPYDDFYHLLNTQYGKAKFFNEPMASYRLHNGGVWSTKSISEKHISNIKIRKMILNYFHSLPNYKNNHLFYIPISDLYKNLAMFYYDNKQKTSFFKAYIAYLFFAKKGKQLTSYKDFLKLSYTILIK